MAALSNCQTAILGRNQFYCICSGPFLELVAVSLDECELKT